MCCVGFVANRGEVWRGSRCRSDGKPRALGGKFGYNGRCQLLAEEEGRQKVAEESMVWKDTLQELGEVGEGEELGVVDLRECG